MQQRFAVERMRGAPVVHQRDAFSAVRLREAGKLRRDVLDGLIPAERFPGVGGGAAVRLGDTRFCGDDVGKRVPADAEGPARIRMRAVGEHVRQRAVAHDGREGASLGTEFAQGWNGGAARVRRKSVGRRRLRWCRAAGKHETRGERARCSNELAASRLVDSHAIPPPAKRSRWKRGPSRALLRRCLSSR